MQSNRTFRLFALTVATTACLLKGDNHPLLVSARTIETATAAATASLRVRSKLPDLDRQHDIHDNNVKSLAKSILDKQEKYSKTAPASSLPVPVAVRGGGVTDSFSNAIAGAVFMALVEFAVKKGLAAADIKFPAMLGGCIVLFVALLLLNAVSPDKANEAYEALVPGATFLTKWLPPFFVPGLVMLPLSPSVGGNLEIAKVIGVIGVGFLFTILTSTFSVVAIRKAQGHLETTAPEATTTGTKPKELIIKVPAVFKRKKIEVVAASKPAKPFDDASANFFYKSTLVTGIASLAAKKLLNDMTSNIQTPLETIFLACATMSSYIWGANLPRDFVKVVHPLVTASVLVLLLLKGVATVTDRDLEAVLRAYKVGSLNPTKMGAGDLLLYLLGPSVVSFAVSMFSRRQLMQQNLLVVLTAVLVSSAGSLFATAGFVRAIALGASSANARLVRLSVLSRNITTALAMAITAIIGGDISIAASVVCLTGILGGTYGKALLTKLQVHDPISRGLGIGCSSQGLGVAAIADEPDAFPFAAIAMVLTAVAATTLVAIPAVKEALINTATGNLVVAAATEAASS